MPNELAVQPIIGTRAGSDAAGAAKADTTQPSFDTEHAAVHPQAPNPELLLDPALGLVVIEFRDTDNGTITTSIPSQAQLAAYQRWNMTHFGPTPSGLPKTAPPSLPGPAAPAPAQRRAVPAAAQSVAQPHVSNVRK